LESVFEKIGFEDNNELIDLFEKVSYYYDLLENSLQMVFINY